MREIAATLKITLYEDIWQDELITRFFDLFNSTYNISTLTVSESNEAEAIVGVETNFSDDESTGETVAYCLSEDMLDNGFELDSIDVLSEEIL